MNDRYLFKAKRTNWKELPKEEWWAVGYLIIDEQDENRHFIGYVFGTNEDGTPHDLDVVEVDPATICQCTGLKDKAKNLIWENDVVATPYIDPIFGDMVNDKILEDYTWKVRFIDGVFCVDNGHSKIYLKSFCKNECVKVLGNIFDNPELLEVE